MEWKLVFAISSPTMIMTLFKPQSFSLLCCLYEHQENMSFIGLKACICCSYMLMYDLRRSSIVLPWWGRKRESNFMWCNARERVRACVCVWEERATHVRGLTDEAVALHNGVDLDVEGAAFVVEVCDAAERMRDYHLLECQEVLWAVLRCKVQAT